MLIGLALIFAATSRPARANYLPLLLMLGVSFFLSANKGGIEKVGLWGGIVLFVYNRPVFREIVTPRRAVILAFVAYFGMGLKNQMLSQMAGQNPDSAWQDASLGASLQRLSSSAQAAYATRFSDRSGYRSFCFFIDTVGGYQTLFHGFRVGEYAVTSWVPRVLYPRKPAHPFEGIGIITNFDLKDSSSTETEAPGWAGAAMADGGYYTLVAYILITGIFLGTFRRIVATSGRMSLHNTYVLFFLLGGFSAEAGILSIMDNLLLALSVVVLGNGLLRVRDIVGVRQRTMIGDALGAAGTPFNHSS